MHHGCIRLTGSSGIFLILAAHYAGLFPRTVVSNYIGKVTAEISIFSIVGG
jgi:hypothetical protein